MVSSLALLTASVVAALPAASRAKPALMSMVSAALVALPKPDWASNAVILALVRVMASMVSLSTLTEEISFCAKVTFAVVASSPLMSHTSLLQSMRALMSVAEVSPVDSREL